MIKIPYSSMELRVALLNFDENKFSEDKIKELKSEFEDLSNDKDQNKRVAEYHGISVEQLINSPNYKVLCEEYGESIIYEFVKKLKEKFETTDKEAWALVLYCLELLN